MRDQLTEQQRKVNMKDRTISEIMADARPGSVTRFERLKLEAELVRSDAYSERIRTMLRLNAEHRSEKSGK